MVFIYLSFYFCSSSPSSSFTLQLLLSRRERTMLPPSAILLAISVLLLAAGDVSSVGINYGTLGDNLPPPKNVAQMLQSTLIDKVKIYDTDPDILDAFANTGIDLVVAVENDKVANLSRNFDAADHWLTSRLSPFLPATSVVAVAVGNEFLTNPDGATSSMDASVLVPAMRNLHQALVIRGLDRKIKVSTPLSMGVLASSFPPSSSTFLDELRPVMAELVEFLIDTGAPFMINAYPYFAYRDNPSKIDLEYALLGNATGVHDPKGYVYTNMLDAQIDAVRSAIKSLGAGNRTVGITVSESGWPSRGDVAATSENSKMYNSRLIARGDAHVGTPMAPREKVDVFVFSLFNENQKEGEASERSFGLFNADGTKAYELDLSCSFCSQEKLSFGEKPAGGARGPSVWCVAKPHADERILQAVLDFSCGPGGVDCRDLREKGACSEPNKLNAHASYAMNAYYQMHGRNYWNCDFKGIGLVTFSDPSYGSCRYSQQ